VARDLARRHALRLIQIKAAAPGNRHTRSMSRHPLLRDVVIVVAAKVAVVIAAGWLVFGPARRPQVDAGRVETRLIGPPAASPSAGNTVP